MVLEKLQQFRRRLLDLSRRNRLLNFKPRASGRRSIHIVDEIPEQVYRILAAEGRTMQFLAAEESPLASEQAVVEDSQDDAGTQWFDLPAVDPEEEPADRHVDLNLQTTLTGKHLQARLLHLSREAASAQEEQGANVLHLALGLLHWRESPDSEVTSASPLLLVPVALHRRSVNQRHAVRAIEDDTVVNPALVELCRRQYRLDLPTFDPDAQTPVEDFFEAIEKAIADAPGWSIDRNEIHLGLFSFTKLLMYLDLDPERWPENKPLLEHHLIRTMCAAEVGRSSSAEGWIDPADLDTRLSPEETFNILDADSSQQTAIVAANDGHSFVIEGPPGTGKSQTIANVIAESLVAGKRVLFVAEKAAALDVVKRRLEQVGLGHFVAELHSRKANRRAFAEDLARAMQAEHPRLPEDHRREAEMLADARWKLSAYLERLHARIDPLKLSAFQAIGRCAELEHAPEAPVQIPDVLMWSPQRLREARECVAALARTVGRIGDPQRHPWRGVGVEDLPLHERQALPRAISELQSTIEKTQKSLADLAQPLSLSHVPGNMTEANRLNLLVRQLLESPPLPSDALSDSKWDDLPAEARLIIDTGVQLADAERTILPRWKPEAYSIDWSPVARAFQRQAHSPLRWLSPGWWSNRALIRRHLSEGTPFDRDDVLSDLATHQTAARLREMLMQMRLQGAQLFGPLWRDDKTDWDALHRYAQSLVALRKMIRADNLDPAALSSATQTENKRHIEQLHGRFMEAARDFRTAWRSFCVPLKIDGGSCFAGSLDDVTWEEWIARLDQCSNSLEALTDWMAFERAGARCLDAGVGEFIAWALECSSTHEPATWCDAFDRQFHRLWLDAVTRGWPEIREFSGTAHEQLIERFRDLDKRWIALTRARVAAKVAARQPGARQAMSANSGLGLLQAEMRRKRGHRPIRRLLSSPAGDVIASLKPCFMMSPMSVAQFLEPGGFEFDVVIFDEASQVDPADALGAIARGRQLLLVGDEKQLPPTDFFRSMSAAEEDDEDEDALPMGDLESVLAVGEVTLGRKTTLRWHYRSRHESLIDFSNQNFYDRLLRIFPSPERDRTRLGLSFRHVSDGVYFRGRGRYNAVEAKAVAEALIDHVRTNPGRTVGVGAFSAAQQRAIEDEIERLRRELSDPHIERFFDPDQDEPPFVKNLETIQGDERDVILLSVGYGFDEHGRITNNFGPINKEGGWRRLNVLITRARMQCIIFSSIKSEHIRIDDSAPRGVQALKNYLYFAELGTMPAIEAPTGEHDSPFERCVAARLREHGYEVHAQVGCAGFSIDLAIIDPRAPGRYIAGIECDGATYHSSATARDRDRIRQAVLEGLGWRIVRVWSTDWFHQPRAALNRLLSQVRAIEERSTASSDLSPSEVGQGAHSESAIADEPASEVGFPPPPGKEAPVTDESEGPMLEGMVPYVRYEHPPRGSRDDLLRTPIDEVAAMLAEIVSVEGPIHRSELLRQAASQYQCRLMTAAEAHLVTAVRRAIQNSTMALRGQFLWPRDMDRPPMRWRGGEGAVTSADLICPEEVAEVAALVVHNDFGVPRDDLPAAAIRAMGFRRLGPQLAELGEAGVALAVEAGRIVTGEGGFVMPAARPSES